MDNNMNKRRGCRGRDRMVVGFITTYLCNQCLLPFTLWVRIPLRRGVLNTTLCDKVSRNYGNLRNDGHG